MADSLNICVFCASSPVVDEQYKTLARDMGALCAAQGWRLVYGGSHLGLMGAMADAALAGGADVTGVIPQHLVEREVAHKGLSRLHITRDMHERQMQMSVLADAFVVLPGGLGTMAEFFEVVTWRQINLHKKPIVVINHNGYWDFLIKMIEKSMNERFLHQKSGDLFDVLFSVDDLPAYFEKTGQNAV